MRKRFSRRKYIEDRINRIKDWLDEYDDSQIDVENILRQTLDCYKGWATECDKLTIEEAKNLGYYVDVEEWLEIE